MDVNEKQFKIIYAISKNAYEMVKEGKANISSGGVRTIDGKLVELAIPTSYTIKNNIPQLNMCESLFAPITMVSSLFNNVQSFLIQKGVDQANKKLDQFSEEIEKISAVQNSLMELGKFNLSITIQKFKEIHQRLNDGVIKIDKILDVINGQDINDIQEKFSRYCSNLKGDIELLAYSEHIEIHSTNIEDHLSNVKAFLEKIIKEMECEELSLNVGMPIIFKLIPGMIEVTKYFSAECYYQHGYIPSKLDECKKILEKLSDDKFKSVLKKYLFMEFLENSTEQRYMLNSYVTGIIKWHIANLDCTKYLIQNHTKNEYINITDKIEKMIENNIRYENNFITLNNEYIGILMN